MKRPIAVLLVVSLCVTNLAPLAFSQGTAYQRGYEDGKRAANQDIKIFGSLIEALWGFLLGPVPVLHSLLFDSKVPARRLQYIKNRSVDYKKGLKKDIKVNLSSLLCYLGLAGGGVG